ncbi:MAG: hypothetical protein QNJ55_30240 [Xenococcus sp. MO_188.B8]|nr:hypothetical protein [Xenococcus sp. MO_188.B8]
MILNEEQIKNFLRANNSFILFERKSGFADRVYRMTNGIRFAFTCNVPLFIHWPINEKCNDHFLNLFEPINHVKFVDEDTANQLRRHHKLVAILNDFFHYNTSYQISAEERFSYLRLQRKYLRIIQEFVKNNNIENVLGFHVRKTDIFSKERQGIKINQYHLFDEIATQTDKKIFMATDNKQTQDDFLQKYGEQIIIYNNLFAVNSQNSLRKTSLESAIIELYILAHCQEVFGTKNEAGQLVSSFSEMAQDLNILNKQNKLYNLHCQYSLQTDLCQKLEELIPEQENIILVDESYLNQSEDQFFQTRNIIPFMEKDGQYWGLPPDDETAIREVKRLRKAGANFLVFIWSSLWWLDYYRQFYQYLLASYHCIWQSDYCVVFRL